MERRPWPIVILALLHFFEPFAKTVFYAFLWEMPVSRLVKYLSYQASPLELFLFAFSFPLAGIAIFAMKKWSLPTFLTIQAITLAGHVYFHLVSPKSFPIYLIASLTVLNALVVWYFLAPSVRTLYLDSRLRWWEAKPRFTVNWHGKVLQGKKSLPVQICNLSQGGTLIKIEKKATLEVEEAIQIEFEFEKASFSMPGVVRHYSKSETDALYGIQFSELTSGTLSKLKATMGKLKKAGHLPMGRRDPALKSFLAWAEKLAKTGQGFFPELPKKTGTTSQISVGKKKMDHRKKRTNAA
jgi:hypothetical protein